MGETNIKIYEEEHFSCINRPTYQYMEHLANALVKLQFIAAVLCIARLHQTNHVKFAL